MSNVDSTPSAPPRSSPPPLSWPPPGLERLQGRLWRAIGGVWVGTLILVLPLLWELATEQPFWSLGPFEGNWQVGMAVAILGGLLVIAAYASLIQTLRGAAHGADMGYGSLTLLEVATDVGRDTGFLIQGRRHFSSLDTPYRASVVRARLRGAVLVLVAALWLSVGFGLAVILASRGFLTASGIWLMTLAPTAVLLALGGAWLLVQGARVRNALNGWAAMEGPDRVHREAEAWSRNLDEAGEAVALGAGPVGEGGRFRLLGWVAAALLLGSVVPASTVAITAAIGPILAEIAVPQFLSVQEMAGAAEVLRRFRLPQEEGIPAAQPGAALQNLAFVGTSAEPEPWERAPTVRYEDGWFPDPDVFPDPFSETVARDLTARDFASFTPTERAALRQAAAHPAHAEFDLLSRAVLADVVGGRWLLPLPDTLSFQSLPWPRFAALRTAGLARVARAAVQAADGSPQDAERTLRELISTGFLLVDQGPTLIDNLTGVVLVNMGGDALEGLYERSGRAADAQALHWARAGAADAARKARAGLVSEDIHSLLQGIPDLVLEEEPLRGLRWEYFATFNTLAPCINVHKMVFGPDDTYDEWRLEAREALVRVRGEVELFKLAEGTHGSERAREFEGFLPRFLSLTLGSHGAPGSCASLIASLQRGTAF